MMKTNQGNNFINPRPCTDEDRDANWEILATPWNETVVPLHEDPGSFTNDHKVSVNATDEAASGADYLAAKLNDAGTYVHRTDMLVKSDVVSNSTVRLWVDASAIIGWSPGVLQVLYHEPNNDFCEWRNANEIIQDFEVLVSGTDTTESYLYGAFHADSQAAFDSSADLPVAVEIQDAGADETLKAFLDASSISGYTGSGTEQLIWTNGVASVAAVGSSVDSFTVKVQSGGAAGFLHDKLHLTASYTASRDMLVAGAINTDKEQLFVKTDTIDGWSDGELLGKDGSGNLTFGDLTVELSPSGDETVIEISFDGTLIATSSLVIETYKVASEAGDTPDYLFNKFNDQGAFNSSNQQLVYFELLANGRLQAFTDKMSDEGGGAAAMWATGYLDRGFAAAQHAGLVIAPRTVPVIKCNEVNGLFVPGTGDYVQAQYVGNDAVPNPPSGSYWQCDLLKIGSGPWRILMVYCERVVRGGG